MKEVHLLCDLDAAVYEGEEDHHDHDERKRRQRVGGRQVARNDEKGKGDHCAAAPEGSVPVGAPDEDPAYRVRSVGAEKEDGYGHKADGYLSGVEDVT